ncbi:MAG TPA: NAD-binding protein, partial [Novosphingobium sp.]|nr:NAD-binding protein [Novosphingobium sp.]
VLAEPLAIVGLVAALWLFKTALIAGLALLFRRPLAVAVESGLLLGQSGEFAFVILAAASALGLVGGGIEQAVLIAAGVSMFITPPVASLAQKLAKRLEARPSARALDEEDSPFLDCEGHVIIAGFGRVGQTAARTLDAEAITWIALDPDAALVARMCDKGEPVFFGDAARVEILARAGIDRASAVVVTMDDAQAASHIVREIRQRWPLVPIHARARDAGHARTLRELGATHCTPEAVEASLQLAAKVLLEIGVPGEVVQRRIEEQRTVEEA